MLDLAPLGAAAALLAGAAFSAYGGYVARRLEDRRARRADLIVGPMDPLVRSWQRIKGDLAQHTAPTRNLTAEFSAAAHTVLRHSHAAGPGDVARANRIKDAANELHRVTHAGGRVEEFEALVDESEAALDDYVNYLVRKLHGPL